jgi:hypothetical protein
MDFTLKTYKVLLKTLIDQGFSFHTFEAFVTDPYKKGIILRHDVDALPENSLQLARVQAEKGIQATYYFRTGAESFDEKIIKEIYSLGHEVGYHYEDVSLAAKNIKSKLMQQKLKGKQSLYQHDLNTSKLKDYGCIESKLVDIAIDSFTKNLQRLRAIAPIKTICMHGSPMSRWDSRILWKYYNYRDFGIIGEPYFDLDFEEVHYLTDTGRSWAGNSFNIRDKPATISKKYTTSLKVRTTYDIIRYAEKGLLPEKIMMTFHPQRWSDSIMPWLGELTWQNVKNTAKYFIIKTNFIE